MTYALKEQQIDVLLICCSIYKRLILKMIRTFTILLKRKLLRIPDGSVLASSPYFQTKTVSRSGCQIDLLIETKFNTLYLGEIRFKKEPIGMSVIEEVKQKMQRMQVPKGFSIRPFLVHVNGVHDSVIESEFFSSIIDFSQLLI